MNVNYFAHFFLSFSLINFGLTKNQNNQTSYAINSVLYEDGCENSTNICIRKCCDLNYILKNDFCVFNNSIKWVAHTCSNYEDANNCSVAIGMVKCPEGDEWFNAGKNFSIQRNNNLWLNSTNESFSFDQYCLEYLDEVGISTFVCQSVYTGSEFSPYKLEVIGMVISFPFLVATFIVYALLPERNLHAMCLMCFVFTLLAINLMIFFCSFIYVPDNACRVVEMLFCFSFMASICWLNVMSYDIWSTFSGTRGFLNRNKMEERKCFFFYSMYAWGVPSSFIALVSTFRTIGKPGAWYNPGVNDQDCWLKMGIPIVLYYFLPISIFAIANIILFVKTVHKIKQAQKETAMLRNRESKCYAFENARQRIILYIKLLFAMGINWSMDIISTMYNYVVGDVPNAIWYITEFFSATFGMFLFFIFVCKRTTWLHLKTRCCNKESRSATVTTTTQNNTETSGQEQKLQMKLL